MSPRTKNRKRNSLLSLFLFFFLSCALAHAQQEITDKEENRKGISNIAETGEPQGVVSESKEGEGYFYDPGGKTDPFKSFIALQEEMEEKKRRKPRTYLETVELSQLQLTVIIISEKESWAMVRDSKGLGHVIKKGTFIGTDGGVVHEIKDDEVVIREEFKDFRGNVKHRDISKRLPSLL
jgi:type IV pilus assembly protein PilP